MNKKMKVALLGCTGTVGVQFARLLEDHPYFQLVALTASGRSVGKPFGEAVGSLAWAGMSDALRAMPIGECTADWIGSSDARIVFSALPASIAGDLELELRDRGCLVFSNASSHRMDPQVPLVISEVNASHLTLIREQRLRFAGSIVANPNCSAAGLVIVLKALLRFGLRAATVTTLQALSGAGKRGVAALDIMGNVIPYIPEEEDKIACETKRMLGCLAHGRIADHDAGLFVSCSRVPVRDGHLQSLVVELEEDVSRDTFVRALEGFSAEPQRLELPTAPTAPIIVLPGDDRPQPVLDARAGEPHRARGMAVSVGRIRKLGERFALFLLVHNTVRGAAGASVLNAELAFRMGYLDEGDR